MHGFSLELVRWRCTRTPQITSLASCKPTRSTRPNESFYRSALLTFGLSARTNRIGAHSRWNDECLRVMHDHGFKIPVRTLHDSFSSLDQIENVHSVARVVRDRPFEPCAASLDEFEFVQASALFNPSRSLTKGLHAIDQTSTYPVCLPFPGDVRDSVIQVDRPWQAVQPQAAPIP